MLKLVLGFFCEGVVGFIREDDVIEERDIEDVASLAELVRLVYVSHARDGSSARVVVEEDDRRGVAHQRFLDDAPVIDLGRLNGSDGNHLLGQGQVGSIEEEDPGLLVIEIPEVFAQVSCGLGRCLTLPECPGDRTLRSERRCTIPEQKRQQYGAHSPSEESVLQI